MKKYLIIAALGMACLAQTACHKNEYADMSNIVDQWNEVKPQPIDTLVFSHPCALYTPKQFADVKRSLESGSAPAAVKQEFEALKNSPFTQSPYGSVSRATVEIVRGDAKGTLEGKENYATAMRDAAAAYQYALLWHLTGNDEYATKGVFILNDWAAICQRVTSNDPNHFLAAGVQGFTFAVAGELLRTYEGWSEEMQAKYRQWILDVFAKRNMEFLTEHCNTTCGAGHYWSNWDLVNMCSYFQIGILCENKEMIEFICNYFLRNGNSNGYIGKLMVAQHEDPLGTGEMLYQMQESGRDQGHATMSLAVTAQLCQAAYCLYQFNPTIEDLDFFKAKGGAVIQGAEYIAISNLRKGTKNDNSDGAWLISLDQVPFAIAGPWCDGGDNHEASHEHYALSSVGRGTARPNWEIIVYHATRLGMSCVYSSEFARKIRPEGAAGDTRYGLNSDAFDQLGWNTLMLYTE